MDFSQVLSRVHFGQAVSRVREDIEGAMKLNLLDVMPSLGGFDNRLALALVGTGASHLLCAYVARVRIV